MKTLSIETDFVISSDRADTQSVFVQGKRIEQQDLWARFPVIVRDLSLPQPGDEIRNALTRQDGRDEITYGVENLAMLDLIFGLALVRAARRNPSSARALSGGPAKQPPISPS